MFGWSGVSGIRYCITFVLTVAEVWLSCFCVTGFALEYLTGRVIYLWIARCRLFRTLLIGSSIFFSRRCWITGFSLCSLRCVGRVCESGFSWVGGVCG